MGLPRRGAARCAGQVLQIRPFPVISGIEEAPAEGRIIGVNGIDFSVLRFRLAIKPLTPVFSIYPFSPVVVCHPLQIRIRSIVERGKKPGIRLPPTGGAPIGPAVFGYIRVSQAEGESGLATQRRILNDHGLRDDRIFTDVASGRNMRRPSWTELRRLLRSGDTVVVPRLDRLARNLWEGLKTIEELHDQGINIRSLAEGLDTGDDSPTSRLMLHMLLSLAEWERDTIRDRIKAGVDRAAAEGRTGGRPPALSPEKAEAVRDFLENGGSVSAAARTFGVSRPTVRGVRDGTYVGQDSKT